MMAVSMQASSMQTFPMAKDSSNSSTKTAIEALSGKEDVKGKGYTISAKELSLKGCGTTTLRSKDSKLSSTAMSSRALSETTKDTKEYTTTRTETYFKAPGKTISSMEAACSD